MPYTVITMKNRKKRVGLVNDLEDIPSGNILFLCSGNKLSEIMEFGILNFVYVLERIYCDGLNNKKVMT